MQNNLLSLHFGMLLSVVGVLEQVDRVVQYWFKRLPAFLEYRILERQLFGTTYSDSLHTSRHVDYQCALVYSYYRPRESGHRSGLNGAHVHRDLESGTATFDDFKCGLK